MCCISLKYPIASFHGANMFAILLNVNAFEEVDFVD